MKKNVEFKTRILKTASCFAVSCLFVSPFGGASSSFSTPLYESKAPFHYDSKMSVQLKELNKLGLLLNLSDDDLSKLLKFQKESGKSLPEIIAIPYWADFLGFTSSRFRSTWYAANPYDHIPRGLKEAIKALKVPYRTNGQMYDWAAKQKFSNEWVTALKAVLIETTPENLWRVSQGKKPFVKNGQVLKPIVEEKKLGDFHVSNGHIATDPRVIPTNSNLLMLVRVNGKTELIKVKAADIGGGVKGHHVDLPVSFIPRTRKLKSKLEFPKKYLSNNSVLILQPKKKSSPNRKV